MKALVVDDSPIDRRLAERMLSKAGFLTRVAENGASALALLAEEPADLVITDLAMPEMDGLELVKAVRNLHPETPVILMTAVGSEDIAVRALQAGAASYVPKRDLARSLAETAKSILAVRGDFMPVSHRSATRTRWELNNDLNEIPPVVAILESRLATLGLANETMRIQLAVALREAIVNAMLHGNLHLPSSLKEADPDAHDALYEERRAASPWRERRVTITVEETPAELRYSVSDEGEGFDMAQVPDPTDPSNLERTSGRGLFLIRTFMDDVSHSRGGRTITMVKRKA